jgi:microcin C transport system permease protein
MPVPAPAPPSWTIDKEEPASAILKAPKIPTASWQLNWLGTDDQGRDVLARLIYGFRISVLFGLALTLASSVIGVAAGAVQGYFGGWTDLLFQRFIEIWTAMPTLYLMMIMASFLPPGFWTLLTIMLPFPGWRLSASCGRSSCAAAISNTYRRRARWA